MPAMAHIGVGLAAKKIAPEMNAGVLMAASEAVEIVFMGLWALGVEHPPTAEEAGHSIYSHSILSGVVISLAVGLLTYLMTKNKKHTILLALLALSHTVMDVLASPMTAFYATDVGKNLYWNENSIRIGFGLYKNPIVAQILEYGITVVGIGIYVVTKIKLRREKKITAMS